jgi:hypothetical protein
MTTTTKQENLSYSTLLELMENARTQDGMAHVVWAVWNASLISWREVKLACFEMGIETIDTYWE